MSYITQYKSTIESKLKGTSNRILLVDESGYQIICDLFSQEEILEMNILGVLKIEDKDLLKADKLFENEIVFFVKNKSVQRIMTIIQKASTHVYIFFYCYMSKEQLDDINQFDINSKICEISHGSLDFYPTSEKSAVGCDVFTVLKNKPSNIIYHKSGEGLKEFVTTILQHNLDTCTLREKTENTLLYVFGRNYDEITPIVTPWRYQSLINYLNIQIGSPGTDKFFAKHKFSLYNEVTDEFSQQTTNLTNQKKTTIDVSDKFLLDEKTRIISKHVEISGNIQKFISWHQLLEKSELEQKSLIGTANGAELKELENVNPKLYQLLMSGKSATLKGFINTLNFLGEDTTRSTYHQYVPPLRELLRILKITHSKYDKIYVYIENYICYEEIAEVALSNTTRGPIIYLLSKSTQNLKLNPALVVDKFERSNDYFKVLKTEFKQQSSLSTNVYYADIETKINYLKKHNVSFKKEEQEMCDEIKITLSTIMTHEFSLLKAEKPKNKLEKNINSIKLSKLSKLATEFGKFEKSDRKTREFISSFDKKYESDVKQPDSRQLLLSMQEDEEIELRNLEYEIDRREHSINDICNKTAEVHAMVVEVSTLVAKHTLMIGTIEENVINACDLVTDGTTQLVQADKHQRDANSLSNKIIVGLFGLVILMGLGVGIKESVLYGHN